jgi:S-formylglutathione hydrolase FrmB
MFSRKIRWLSVLLILGLPLPAARAVGWRKENNGQLEKLNRSIQGKVVDYTANHGQDNRIWSRSLYQRRDLYVYLPPHYDPHQRYPLMYWLHGFSQDEHSFLTEVVPLIDEAISCGKLPPLIAVAPDGSINGEPSLTSPGSFFLNTQAGYFADFVLEDVWDFVVSHYPICPDRQAHVIAGVSMGGFAAYNLAIKHRECWGIVIGVFPPLNLRWMNKEGNYMANFDPCDWGWRTELDRGGEVIGRFACGLFKIRLRHVIDPLFSTSENPLLDISQENPIEMIDRYNLREGELSMYVGYGGKDEFNIDAQVESFLYLCKWRSLSVAVGYEPKGHHDYATALKLFPGIVDWLAPQLAPFAPPVVVGDCVSPCLPTSPPCEPVPKK